MFPKQPGVIGEEEIQKRDAEGGVGEADFSRLLRWRFGAKQQQEKKPKTNAPKLQQRFLPGGLKSGKGYHATDYKQRIENLSTFSRRNPLRGFWLEVMWRNAAP